MFSNFEIPMFFMYTCYLNELWIIDVHLPNSQGCPHGVMVKVMGYGIVVREFVLQSCYYIHFRANALGKGI